ncbi:ABC transporter permease [Actinacidiphila sp. ITFR-21]|uniref:ABC transporter permease n=1 Tax=Actinacidiphila sp. ITFR-21 TaxID=3075199 RepID=UPI00288A3636|nr:ABC transporter permease [Streptomyces sp. ITFR-21]WNI14232.1 ABC transporter permease [Streptomyces sp. ITFR-21]
MPSPLAPPDGGSIRLRTRRAPVPPLYVAQRLAQGAVTVVAVVAVVFLLLHLTGNPARVVSPPDATQDEIDRIAHAYGFDQPIAKQFVLFFGKAFTGRFPDSVTYGTSSLGVVRDAIGPTLLLAGSAFVLGNLVGLVIGYLSAEARWRPLRRVPIVLALVGQSVPAFYLGLLAVLLLAVRLGWFPTAGYGSFSAAVLPTLVLTASIVPGITRIYRAQILEVRDDDHVVTAVAKGIPPLQVRLRHIALNALGPAVALIGLQLGGVVAGAVTVEVIFNWPGMGQLLVSSINGRDYAVALTAVLFIAVGFVVATLLADLAAVLVDPFGHRRR